MDTHKIVWVGVILTILSWSYSSSINARVTSKFKGSVRLGLELFLGLCIRYELGLDYV